MAMTVIVDYGMGNLRSVQKAFESVGQKALVSSRAGDIISAEKIVLPGVGAFGNAMVELEQRGLTEPIIKFVNSARPFLGICLGLQLLFTESEEEGGHKGFNILAGKVKRFPDEEGLKVPHMGWNRIRKTSIGKSCEAGKIKECPLLKDIADGTYMYFVHSYYAQPEDNTLTAAWTDYGIKFASMICRDNIYAVQFHPEKSQEMGLRILKNFARL